MNEQVSAVQRMQDYIRTHFDQEITLADLSRAAAFSPWYAHRLFREKTGISPADYIRRLRLAEAARQLRQGKNRILEIALDLGFGSVDGFTRAFVREFGIKPNEYRHHPVPIPLFIPYDVKYSNERKEADTMEPVKTVFVQLIHKPQRKGIIKRGERAQEYWEYCDEVGCDVWGILTSMDSLCGEPVCLWLPPWAVKPNTSTYVQGVEVGADYTGAIPDGFDVIDLPACEYLMFQGEPFREEDYCQAITAVQEAMDRYVPSVMGYEWDRDNPRIQLEPIGARGYIELMPVRKMACR